jgi:hypothetical protein
MKYLCGNRSLLLLVLSALVNPTCSWASLVYYGGPVVSNAQVVMVNWGANVPIAAQNLLPVFYGDIVQSDYWTIFTEYGTNILANDGGAGTNQQIGFGSFAGMFTIAPVKCSGTSTRAGPAAVRRTPVADPRSRGSWATRGVRRSAISR